MRRAVHVRHIHASGRYDRPAETLLRALRGYVRRAHIITLTEVDRESRAKVLDKLGPKWKSIRGSGFSAADEVGILWNSKVWAMTEWHSKSLTRETGSQRQGIACLTVVLQHVRTGEKILVSTAHLPADVEYDMSASRLTAKTAAHRRSATAWRDHVKRMVSWHPNLSGVVLAADWNLDLHHGWVQDWAARTWGTRLRPTWLADMPHHGTHGNRLIDWTLTDLKVKTVRLLKRNPSSDHTPYFEVLVLPKNGDK